ncbi:MAG: hypothetical protein HOP22_08340 [Nitrospiraceae bacterium]|nr:hypothetical protein [Nitrospiraceae bacterium]
MAKRSWENSVYALGVFGLYVWEIGGTPRRVLKKTIQQGRSKRRGVGVRPGTLSL